MPKKTKKRVSRSKPTNRPTSHSSAVVRVSAPTEKPWEIQGEQLTILKNAICKGATDVELQYCLTAARRYKLDPFKRQIWFVSRWDRNADNGHGGTGANVWTPQVGIDGLLFMSARDHKADFGSVSEPEYGPIVNGHPEWARVKVFKRGVTEPTVGVAYWDEYAPSDMTKAPFWRKMPRRMIGKCATALALRQAYPDLGGLYIPEECEKIAEDFTPSGRAIVTAGNGHNQPVQQFDENIPHGHEPGSEKAKQAEAALARVEAADKELVGAKAAKPTASDQPETQNAAIDAAAPQTPSKHESNNPRGTIEIDLTGDQIFLRGDIGDLLELIQTYCTAKWTGDWWTILPGDVQTIHAMAQQLNYRVIEILPKQVPPQGKGVAQNKAASSAAQSAAAPTTSRKETNSKPTASAGSVPSASTAPSIVKGTIQHFTEKMTKGSARKPSAPYMNVLIKTESGDRWYSAFDRDLFEYVSKAKGKSGEFLVTQNGDFWNLVGFKMLAGREFDGKVPVIQKDRAPGREGTLFNP